jgi:hypothetical protein
VSASEIDSEIARLQQVKKALEEKSKTTLEHEQRDLIIKSHPFFKGLRSVSIEFFNKQIALMEKGMHQEIDESVEKAKDSHMAAIRGQFRALTEWKQNPPINANDVKATIDKIANGQEAEFPRVPEPDSFGGLVHKALVFDRRMDNFRETHKKVVSEELFKVTYGMEKTIDDVFLPRLYSEHEIQELLKADAETQDAWLQKFREGLGLTAAVTGEVEKKGEASTTDVEKRFAEMKRQQSQGSTDVERKFQELLKKRDGPKSYVS